MDPGVAYKESRKGLGEAITGRKPPSDAEVMAMYIARLSNVTGIDPGGLTVMLSTHPDKFSEVAHNAGFPPPPISGTPVPEQPKLEETKPKASPTSATAPAPPAGLYPSASDAKGTDETPAKVAADLAGSEGTDFGPENKAGGESTDDLTKPAGPTKSEIGNEILAGLTGLKRPELPPNPPAVAPQGSTPIRMDSPLAGVPTPELARRRTLRDAIGGSG